MSAKIKERLDKLEVLEYWSFIENKYDQMNEKFDCEKWVNITE